MHFILGHFSICASILSGIKKSKKKISYLERQAKLDPKDAEKPKSELIVAVQERNASYAAITEARGEVVAIQGQLDKALG